MFKMRAIAAALTASVVLQSVAAPVTFAGTSHALGLEDESILETVDATEETEAETEEAGVEETAPAATEETEENVSETDAPQATPEVTEEVTPVATEKAEESVSVTKEPQETPITKEEKQEETKETLDKAVQTEEPKEPKVEVRTTLATGDVQAELDLVLPVDYSKESALKGTLTSKDGKTYTMSFSYDSASEKVYGEAKNVEPGAYTLTLKGQGYIPYTQTVNVQAQYTSKITITNSHENDELYTTDKRPGVIGYGDVNDDGVINQEDQELVLDAVAEENNDAKYDLNNDGIVDILDASYIIYNVDDKNIDSLTTRMLSLDAIGTIETEAKVIGDINDIFQDTGSVQLKPANNAEISEKNPVEISIPINTSGALIEGITIAAPTNAENAITGGTVTVEDEEGNFHEAVITNASTRSRKARAAAATAIIQADGSIVVDLGKQVAIKKVTISVTATNSKNLAEIAKVEFLNDMENRIPEPAMESPQNVKVIPANKSFTLEWNKMSNVNGYELQITCDGKTNTITTGRNTVVIKQFANEELKNGKEYCVRIRAFNGDWKSDFSEEVVAVPVATNKPAPPEEVKIEGGFKLLNISWKDMDDTDSYNLYYREQGTKEYTKVEGIKGTSYQVTDLGLKTTYEVYLEGVNEIGVSNPSPISVGKTTELEYAKTSNYKLINRPTEEGQKTAHIESVSYPAGTAENPDAVIDNDYSTDWKLNAWNSGAYSGRWEGPIITFDQEYTMDRIIVVESAEQTYDYFYSRLAYWDADGKAYSITGKAKNKTDATGKRYYEFILDEPITTNKVQIMFSNYLAYNDGMISIAEIKFYEYVSLEADVYNLFEDDTHLTLKSWVEESHINELDAKLDEIDEVSGEYHYKRDILKIELENARAILNEQELRKAMAVDTSISKAHDGHVDFQSGLNAWQPLGITAHEGEELVLYVGKEGAKVGQNTNLRLVATQFHAESGKWHQQVVSNLKVGRNEVRIPKISSMAVEHGGALYVEYTSDDTNAVMSVRVSGGTEYPILDISNVTTEAEQKAAIRAYLTELQAYVAKVEEMHNEHHLGHEDTNCNYGYDHKNCIFNITDIVTKQMMYSVAAEQVLAGLSSKAGSDLDALTNQMYDTLTAMEKMLDLFYQHKGLVAYPTDKQEYDAFVQQYGNKNMLPVSRQNIRYQRMFAGAFMYAGGLHIGIEWGSIPGLMTAVPVVSDNGKYVSGNYFGWGIGHEVGHIINQSQYAVAEITNNYYAQLAQAEDTNESVRWLYKDVYEKVTSGTIGASDDGAVSLAMYWQLHLAYDNGYNFKTYDTYEEQFNNLLFARMDAYARNNSLAPKFANGKTFTLDGADKDNALMRLAVAASGRDILDFFRAWGMVPDATTIEYANGFQKETRKIQFISDDARAYRIENAANADAVKAATESAQVSGSLNNQKNSNQVTINFSATGMDADSVLGYEITRNGETIAFVEGTETSYVDTVTFNNKVAVYGVAVYDKFLNKSAEYKLDEIKIMHDGSVAKDAWSISTNMSSEQDERDEHDTCGTHPIQAISAAIDNDYTNVYEGTVANKDAEIILNLGEVTQIAGFKVTQGGEHAISKYEVQVSLDGSEWTSVKTGTLDTTKNDEVVYFTKGDDENGTRLDIQQVAYVKLITVDQNTVSLSELDIIGEPDDNIELIENGIGKLAADYVVDEKANVVIPKGTVIFTGDYTGHPAFNVMLLIDADTGKVVGGSQYIFAEDPKDEDLSAVSHGTWVFCIEPNEDGDLPALPKNVKAELYRVDNATTLEGQRFVSDTLTVNVPEVLPDITLN